MKTNFDYTSVIPDFIYRTRPFLDDFGVEEPMTLNNSIYEAIYKKYSLLKDVESYARNMFNAAYYICTIVQTDSHPDRRLKKIMKNIRLCMHLSLEHAGVAYAIALLHIRSQGWDTSPAIKRLTEAMERELQHEYEKNYKEIYLPVKEHLDQNKGVIKLPLPNEFHLRKINRQMLKRKSFIWKRLLGTDEDKIVEFILAFGKSEEEQMEISDCISEDMAQFFDDEESYNCCFNNVERRIHEYNLSAEKEDETTPQDRIAQLENENAGLRAQIIQLKEEAADETETKGLTREQAALFIHALATYYKFNFTNKKSQLAPIVNKIFGYGTKSIEKRLCEGYEPQDRKAVGRALIETNRDFVEYIRFFEKKNNNTSDIDLDTWVTSDDNTE